MNDMYAMLDNRTYTLCATFNQNLITSTHIHIACRTMTISISQIKKSEISTFDPFMIQWKLILQYLIQKTVENLFSLSPTVTETMEVGII